MSWGKIALWIAANWDMLLLWLAVAVVAMFGIYLLLAYANIAAKRDNARMLRELLDAAGWADIVQLLKNEDYVQAVLNGCEYVLEG